MAFLDELAFLGVAEPASPCQCAAAWTRASRKC
jgi:hypothetical protein